jgi:HSP20 family protein
MDERRFRPGGPPIGWPALCEGPWRPSADVYRLADGWLVKVELAGVRPDEIQVVCAGARLIVRGARRDFLIREAAHTHSMEISYNSFERSLDFPERVDCLSMETRYQDGMLLIRLVGSGRG